MFVFVFVFVCVCAPACALWVTRKVQVSLLSIYLHSQRREAWRPLPAFTTGGAKQTEAEGDHHPKEQPSVVAERTVEALACH